jgi:hypothetical protein
MPSFPLSPSDSTFNLWIHALLDYCVDDTDLEPLSQFILKAFDQNAATANNTILPEKDVQIDFTNRLFALEKVCESLAARAERDAFTRESAHAYFGNIDLAIKRSKKELSDSRNNDAFEPYLQFSFQCIAVVIRRLSKLLFRRDDPGALLPKLITEFFLDKNAAKSKETQEHIIQMIPAVLIALSHVDFRNDKFLYRVLVSNVFGAHFEKYSCATCCRSTGFTSAATVPADTERLLEERSALFGHALALSSCSAKLRDFVLRGIFARYLDRASAARGDSFVTLLKQVCSCLRYLLQGLFERDEASFYQAIATVSRPLLVLSKHGNGAVKKEVFVFVRRCIRYVSSECRMRSSDPHYQPVCYS